MGITIGDSLAVVALLVGIGLSLWALLVAIALLFPERARASEVALTASAWRPLLLGAMVLISVGTFSLVLAGMANPGAKLFGTIGLLVLLAHASIGATGMARLIGERITRLDPGCSAYRAQVRGTGFLVVAGFLPFLGWFAFTPLILCASLGAGILAMGRRYSLAAPPVIE